MYSLYVLRSCVRERHHIGITADCHARLMRHNAGGVKSTKAYGPWKIVHVEEFSTKTEARKRELFLKRTARARKELFDKIDKEEMPSSSNG